MNTQPHRGPPPPFDREREHHDQRQRAAEDMAHREREQSERAHREPYHPNMPHHNTAGSIPIHQPVASRMPGIHSPSGLLANHGSTSAIPLGAPPSGPVLNFGGPLHEQQGNRPPVQHGGPGNPGPHHQLFGPMPQTSGPPSGPHGPPNIAQSLFGGPLPPQDGHGPVQPSQGPGAGQIQPQQQGGQGPATQGQQPILNDALTYLDQVKVQFHDQPEVYNRFLDIMKDFKSQSIDTPGVINRVSELFAGHPNLIQGFNTFLPPGYRIECGTGNDPNTIRVTTPMGTTVQSIAGRAPNQGDPHTQNGGRNAFFSHRPGNWSQHPQPPGDGEAGFGNQPPGPQGVHYQNQGQGPPFEGPGPGQRPGGPSQLHNAAVPAPGPGPHNVDAQTPSAAAAANGAAAQLANQEKRGPVEFNHAISYVNKIKNRFQDKPEIYKQFLEILQTYQRESKAIADVYSQVTTLFHAAPDLLEDFKQFLPETAGQKTTPGRTGEEGTPAPGTVHTPQAGAVSGPKMPPLGSFAPPASASKESKKRPRNEKQTPTPITFPVEAAAPTGSRVGVPASKKPKLAHSKGVASEAQAVEPTLTPVVPEPIPPPSAAAANPEELAFFDRVKKYLGNRTSMTEFLKLCNLFSQQIIDRDSLYHQGCNYLMANQELLAFWKTFLQYDPQDVVVDNVPAPPTGKVSLSNCRAFGPSYRLLPKRERLKPCSGRDELCMSVLNDDWASHPTWASEDSGFVAHRKNAFEEGLHRIEEERHDYDFNIETNLKCIQLLEPIAQQMLMMTPAEQEQFRMPAALAGQSISIFKRVCKKLYGDKGIDVVNDLFSHPFSVLPVVLARMKQKDEEWRFSQREWSKVWHTQTAGMHLKSLDHMGILAKQADKRQLSAKHLVDVIKTKHEEQHRERGLKGSAPRHQFQWSFSDKDVTLDLLRLMALYAIHNSQHSNSEKERIWDFFVDFIPTFFDLDDAKVQDRIPKFQVDSGEEDGDEPNSLELTNGRSRRNGKRGDLLRGVLDPGRGSGKSRASKDNSASGSKETTPDVASGNEEETPEANDDANLSDASNERWMPSIPRPTITKSGEDRDQLTSDNELKADGYFQRPWYNFFCNQTLYVFFSILHVLYRRLVEVKESRDIIAESITRVHRPRPATDIGISDPPNLYFEATDTPETYWPKTLDLIEEYIVGDIDESRFQEVMRHFYLKTGWKLYTIQDLIRTLCRLALTCSSVDGKDKTYDLIKQFLSSREREETSYQTEISARKFAEKCVKDGELFVICWVPNKSEASVRWLQREETTFYMDEMKLQERWQYYISSYIRVEPTEGIPRSKLSKAVLMRNLPSIESDSDDGSVPNPISYDEGLVVSICLRTSKMVWAAGSSECLVHNSAPASKEAKAQRDKKKEMASLHRAYKLREKFVMNNSWMKDLSREEVEKQKADYKKWAEDGVVDDGPVVVQDVEMGG